MRLGRGALAGLLALGLVGSVAAQEPTPAFDLSDPAAGPNAFTTIEEEATRIAQEGMGGFATLTPEEEAALANEFAGTAARAAQGIPATEPFVPDASDIGAGWEATIHNTNTAEEGREAIVDVFGGPAGARALLLVFGYDVERAQLAEGWAEGGEDEALLDGLRQVTGVSDIEASSEWGGVQIKGCAQAMTALGSENLLGSAYDVGVVICSVEPQLWLISVASGPVQGRTGEEAAAALMVAALEAGDVR